MSQILLENLTLQTLSDILKDQTKWPLVFEWDYQYPSNCAFGLINILTGNFYTCAEIQHHFNLSEFNMDRIFFESYIIVDKEVNDVTAEDVAFIIDRYLKTGDLT